MICLDKFQALIQMKDANSAAQAKLVNPPLITRFRFDFLSCF